MTLPAFSPRAWVSAEPGRTAVAKAVGINFAGSAAFYLAVSDRKHWRAAVAAGLLGIWLYHAGASAPETK